MPLINPYLLLITATCIVLIILYKSITYNKFNACSLDLEIPPLNSLWGLQICPPGGVKIAWKLMPYLVLIVAQIKS